jgi:hypothetical protein
VIKFPDEDGRAFEVRKRLASTFDLAEDSLSYWLKQSTDEAVQKSGLPDMTRPFVLALDVQACRLLRSVLEECGRCEAHNASILARTLFETALGTAFLLFDDVRIKTERSKKDRAKYTAVPCFNKDASTQNCMLSRERRADLYHAFIFFQVEKVGLERLGEIPENKAKIATLRAGVDPAIAAQIERNIGPGWAYIIRNGKSFSGLTVANLAKLMGEQFLTWYRTIYHFQSLPVHAHDLFRHIDLSDDEVMKPQFLSSDKHVYEALRSAITMFLVHVRILHQNVEFGKSATEVYEALEQRHNSLEFSKK